ncbi:MAG: peptidoglycan D,D-transpeptidase FtsI family protein [Bacillota bacterium]
MDRRIGAVWCGTLTLLLLLCLKLGLYSCVNARALASNAIAQRTASVPLETPRFDVFDRNGVALNSPEWRPAVAVFPGVCGSVEATDRIMAFLTGRHLMERKPQVVEVDQARLRMVQEVLGDGYLAAAGIVAIKAKARYGASSIARHVVGYVSDSSQGGICGVELALDDWLRKAVPTRVAVQLDSSGMQIPWLGFRVLPGSGTPDSGVYLTIDHKLQRALEAVLDGCSKPCAGVVLDVRTGQVLAMSSRPQFDQERVGASVGDARGPFLNRALRAYTPGSVFKLVTAACAVEEGLVSPTEEFHCDGSVRIGNSVMKCSKKEGHGNLTIEGALADSCNVSFTEIGRRIGASRLLEYARALGFGSKTGVGLPDEQPGNLPQPASLYLGDLANVSIGQGAVTVTPLQVAACVAAIAGDGLYHTPRIVLKAVDERGQVVFHLGNTSARRVMSQETANTLKRALCTAVRPGHTGAAAWVDPFGCGGKTGSAETGRLLPSGESVLHSWFAGFAPLDAPEYAACIFVEDGGFGGEVAAPMFARLMQAIFRSNLPEY